MIVVSFLDPHGNYYSGYIYVLKEDISVHNSKYHPNLENISSPRTKKLTKVYRDFRKDIFFWHFYNFTKPSQKLLEFKKQKQAPILIRRQRIYGEKQNPSC